MLERIKKTFTPKYIIVLLAVWQLFSVLLMALGYWPTWLVYVNLGALLAYLAIFDSFHSVLLLIASIPFYVVLPNSRFESMSMWRILFAALFGIWGLRELLKGTLKDIVFLPWDKPLAWFVVIALVSLAFAKFKVEGLKQILFLLNVYFLYIVLVNVVKTKEQVLHVLKAAGSAIAVIGVVGYFQLILTFFMSFEMFTAAWAFMVSKLYYGQRLADVLLYSNSWFSYTGGIDLRMFSILPDSHSFALLMLFGINFLMALTFLFSKKVRAMLWSGIRFGGLGIILSGTRAAWVGLLAPLAVTVALYVKGFARDMVKKAFWPLVIILVLFALSPFINLGLRYVRVSRFEENFIDRAKSIYNPDESSNAGRIQMWKESLAYYVRHPWGTGMGNFITISPQTGNTEDYSQVAEKKNTRYNLPEEYVTAHSLYLQTLVEMSVVGLAVLLWFLWKLFTEIWKFLKRHPDGRNWQFFFVLNSGLVLLWLFASAVFDVTLYNDLVLICFFITLGLTGVVIRNYETFKE